MDNNFPDGLLSTGAGEETSLRFQKYEGKF